MTSPWIYPAFTSLVAFAGLSWLQFAPVSGEPVAALFPPWWDTPHSFSAVAWAGGRIVRPGRLASVVIATGTDDQFSDRLREAGAWLVVKPSAASLCGQPAAKEKLT